MRIEAKHRKTKNYIKGVLVTFKEAISRDPIQYKSLRLNPRELVVLEDKKTFPFCGHCYELREMSYILKECKQ